MKESLVDAIPLATIQSLRKAASDCSRINGLTHSYYKYPARFSPLFVGSAIEHFSSPGDLVLDPYMGGGTAIVEAYIRQRMAVGCDLNSLAYVVTKAKISLLKADDKLAAQRWAASVASTTSYRELNDGLADIICPLRTRNLNVPRARPAKKLIALAMLLGQDIQPRQAREFVTAVLLNVAQWALHNRKTTPSLDQIRARIVDTCSQMLAGMEELASALKNNSTLPRRPILLNRNAEDLPLIDPFVKGEKARLVITSPPYPGIHVLYHRWQIDGRKETPAPYWIANCYDGKGASYYNFADRRQETDSDYFENSLKTLRGIRSVMSNGATMIQMIAFSNPRRQLPRYLKAMEQAGFREVRDSKSGKRTGRFRRIWRLVPSRTWYATLKGSTNSAREVVLIHRAC